MKTRSQPARRQPNIARATTAPKPSADTSAKSATGTTVTPKAAKPGNTPAAKTASKTKTRPLTAPLDQHQKANWSQ